MKNTKWSHLPNAKHIDRVLASLKENPKAWDAIWGAIWGAARNAAWGVAWYAIWGAERGAARTVGRDAARVTARYAAWNAAWVAAWGAIAALVAYDHCEKYLGMTPDELLFWWKLSEDPACLLLMPMVKVQTEKELA